MGTDWAHGRFGFTGFNTILPPKYGACNAYTFTGTQPPRSRHVGGVQAASAVTGCSRYHEDEWSKQWLARVPAGGMVEYQWKPVEGAAVVFVSRASDSGREYVATGMTDQKGKFRLRTFRPNDGAVVGIHRVQIEKMEGVVVAPVKGLSPEDQPRVEKSVLPAKYRQHKSSGLTAEVTSKGPNHFLFSLDDSPPPKAAR